MGKKENNNIFRGLSHRSLFVRGEGGWRLDCTGLRGGDRALILRVLAAAVIFVLALVTGAPAWLSALLLVAAIVLGGSDIIFSGITSALSLRFADPCVFITIAGVVTFCTGSFGIGAAIFLLYQIIELLLRDAVHRVCEWMLSKSDINLPETALIRRDGKEAQLALDAIQIGDTLILERGAMAPADCIVSEGGGAVDLTELTGRETPLTVRENDDVPAGAVNLGDRLVCQVTELPAKSGSAMLATIRRTAAKRPFVCGESGNSAINAFFIAVAVIAVITAIAVPAMTDAGAAEGLQRASALLALGGIGSLLIGVPFSYLAALSSASKCGVIYRDTAAIQSAAKADTVVFEKRGTLAASDLRVMAVKTDKMDADMMLKIAAHAEAYSKDPVAKSIIAAYGGVIYIELIQKYREIPGEGIAVMIQNIPIMLGSQHFLEAQGISVRTDGGVERAVFMAVNGTYAGRIVLGSSVNEDAVTALQALPEVGVRRTVITTDEGSDSAAAFADAVGIRDVKPEFNPKVNAQFVGDLVSKQQGVGAVVFVAGDAANAEAMERADVGVIMGGVNDCIACTAADMMILSSPTMLAESIGEARSTRKNAWFGVAAGVVVKLLIAALCVFGVANAWVALLVDGIASAVSAILSALIR